MLCVNSLLQMVTLHVCVYLCVCPLLVGQNFSHPVYHHLSHPPPPLPLPLPPPFSFLLQPPCNVI